MNSANFCQTIHCKTCGNSYIGFGNTYVSLDFKKYIKCCNECNNSKEEVISSSFYCSEECFYKAMRDAMERGDF